MDYRIDQLKQKAANAKPSTKKLFSRLRKSKSRHLDKVVHEIHDHVFDRVNCLQCANCCKTISPILHQNDIDRLAKTMKMTSRNFMDQYITLDADNDFVFNRTPCPFLGSDNYCAVYNDRPKACREYPHTNRKRFHQILPLTVRNAEVCPAVYEIVETLKQRQQDL